jgi:CRP-like cAMP-binding protein
LIAEDLSNQLLAALSPEEFERVAPHLVDLDLPVGHVLFNPGDIIRDVYFPTTAIISIMNVMRDGKKVEVAAVGHEGMVGIRMFFDDDEAFAHAICQAPGHVLKMDAPAFWMIVREQAGMRHVVHHYVHAFLFEVFQSAACNMVHTVRQRFARWILTKQDRARTNAFPLSPELIADMLTITQPGARALLDQLIQERLIDYQNGVVQIINPPGLEAIVCECYERVQIEFSKIRVKREMREP